MDLLKRLNASIYRAERAIVVASLLVMSAVMFLAVVHRSYADADSAFFSRLAIFVLGAERGDATWLKMQEIADWAVPLGLAAAVYAAFRTASRRPLWNRPDAAGTSGRALHGEPRPHLRCLLYTALTLAVGWGLLALLFGTGAIEQSECLEHAAEGGGLRLACGLFPAGLRWATSFSLVLTLWVGFLGASMATRDNVHLKLEAANKALPERARRITGLLAGVVTAAVCLLLAYLGARFIAVKYDEWDASGGLGGLHESTPIPYFLSFTIVPLAWILMAARFIGIGVLALRGELRDASPALRELERAHGDAAAQEVAP